MRASYPLASCDTAFGVRPARSPSVCACCVRATAREETRPHAALRRIPHEPLTPMNDFAQDIADVASIEAIPTILDIVCRTTGMRFAAVARVTADRWIACSVRDEIDFGVVPGGELDVETTLCNEIRQSGEAIIIDSVADDGCYHDHRTPKIYGLQSYIAVPIRLRDGSIFGTLCAIDPEPHRLRTDETQEMFTMFANVIGFQLSAVRRANLAEASLMDEQATSALREQFIAVLGHDLRNPLASIGGGVRLLRREPQTEKAATLLGMLEGSVVRMSTLIDNVLDFARGRLGGGLILSPEPILLQPVLQQVIDEMRVSVPDREIISEFDVEEPVACDPSRMGQLVSNLVGNALVHGAAETPIRFTAIADGVTLTIMVANNGDEIAPEAMKHLFQPFFRGEVRPSQQGLGLGLHIAAEIAKAHGGNIAVDSSPEETRFTFTMPLPAPS